MRLHRLLPAIWLAGLFALGAVSSLQAGDVPSAASLMAQAQPQQPPAPAATPAASPAPDANAPADQQAAGDEPIGNVASLTGVATVIRNKDSISLKLKDDIYLNDSVQTSASSSLGITFNDATTFHLSANAKITIDTYVYADGGSDNNGVFDIAKGTVAFVAAQVARTGNMQITTPTATLGIRGTTGLVEVPEDGAAAANANIKLYPDADGHVGRIEVNDRMGTRLGALTAGASGFSIRPGTGGARFAAVPLTISPQQQTRDQGFVRQVHATQSVGRQIVTEQRAFRRANPGLNNRNNPARPGQPGQQPGQNRPGQPGQQRPGQPQPGQNRPGQPQQPGTPNNRQGNGQGQRPGQPGQPGQGGQPSRQGQTTPPANPAAPGTPSRADQATPTNPAQPGTPPRPGQTAQPARPGQPTGQPTPPPLPSGQPLLRQSGPRPAGGLQRPGFQNRPAVQRPKQLPPKDKKKH